MIISVKVIPNSSKDFIEKQEDNSYKIWTKEKAVNGKANLSVKKIIAKYFGVHVVDIEIKSRFFRTKKVTINNVNA